MQKNIIILAIFLSFALNIKAQNNTGFIRRPRDIQIKKNHLETFGIEIDGDVNAFQVKLTKIFNEQNGTFSKNGTETYYNISLPESETSETPAPLKSIIVTQFSICPGINKYFKI